MPRDAASFAETSPVHWLSCSKQLTQSLDKVRWNRGGHSVTTAACDTSSGGESRRKLAKNQSSSRRCRGIGSPAARFKRQRRLTAGKSGHVDCTQPKRRLAP